MIWHVLFKNFMWRILNLVLNLLWICQYDENYYYNEYTDCKKNCGNDIDNAKSNEIDNVESIGIDDSRIDKTKYNIEISKNINMVDNFRIAESTKNCITYDVLILNYCYAKTKTCINFVRTSDQENFFEIKCFNIEKDFIYIYIYIQTFQYRLIHEKQTFFELKNIFIFV